MYKKPLNKSNVILLKTKFTKIEDWNDIEWYKMWIYDIIENSKFCSDSDSNQIN